MSLPETKLKARKKPRQARSEQTFNLILDVTEALITTTNLGKLTTRVIAKKAGVSTGTLYQYFPSREAILNEVVARRARRAEPKALEFLKVAACLPLGDALALLVHRSIQVQQGYPVCLREIWDKISDPEGVRDRRQRGATFFMSFLANHPEKVQVENLALTCWNLTFFLQVSLRHAITENPSAAEDGSLMREATLFLCRYIGTDPPQRWPPV
jgi:AcrR family transcriptional regulator